MPPPPPDALPPNEDGETTRGDHKLQPALGMVIASKYRLDRLLREGGMGSVWVARHLDLDIDVAVKFVNWRTDDGGTESFKRFKREARAAARIKSSNVVKILDHGVDQLLPYIVMEFLEGEDLAARLKRHKTLSFPHLVEVLVPVAQGLQIAHDAGLVHRDLKPENIFIAKEGDNEIAKILDFGVVKMVGVEVEDQTREGMMLGTPSYMSPEQAYNLPIDHRVDLWALGVIAYRAIVGERPFPSRAIGQLMVEICSKPIPWPRQKRPELPEAVDLFFQRALARDPKERFQSARGFADGLRELATAAEGQLGVAAPPSAPVSGDSVMPTPNPTPGMTPASFSAPSLSSTPSSQALQPSLSDDVPWASPPAGSNQGRTAAIAVVAATVTLALIVGVVSMTSSDGASPAAAVPSAAQPSAAQPSAAQPSAAQPDLPPPPAATAEIEINPDAEPSASASSSAAASVGPPTEAPPTNRPSVGPTTPPKAGDPPDGKKPARDLGY
jgi:serine/threonine-protein kinase